MRKLTDPKTIFGAIQVFLANKRRGLPAAILAVLAFLGFGFFGGDLLSKFGLTEGQGQKQSFVNAAAFKEAFKAKVIRVSDGDTLVVETEDGQQVKIRVVGIDTPEKFVTAKLKKDAAECGVSPELMSLLGKEASKHAHEYLEPGKTVLVVPEGQGKYGRLIARIVVDGKDYGLQMIKEGYSCVYEQSAPPEYKEALEEAKKNRAGLWKDYYEVMECLCK
ncbi:MAG: thermonuclease family protein [Aquificae bacterium]|nr:thermonuclease family protein [Aquificota bacterium]